MGDWTRDTPWRQGHVLRVDAVTALGLCNPESAEECVALVISHDCDLANGVEQEPGAEVVVGRRIGKVDGNFTHTKNPRRLHLEFRQGEAVIAGDFLATAKRLVPKAVLADYRPRDDLVLTPQDHEILQRWLAARYRRAAFPDEFVRRLGAAKLDERLVRILAPSGSYIRAVLFDVDGGREITREGEDDLYELDIIVLYTTEEDPEKAFAAASKAKSDIEKAFREKLYAKDHGWKSIELRDCMALSDDVMTVRQSGLYKQWRVEYISLRGDPSQPMLEG